MSGLIFIDPDTLETSPYNSDCIIVRLSAYVGRTEIASQVDPAREILICVVSSSSLNWADWAAKHGPGEILNDILLDDYYGILDLGHVLWKQQTGRIYYFDHTDLNLGSQDEGEF